MTIKKIISRLDRRIKKLREENDGYLRRGKIQNYNNNCLKLQGIDIAKGVINHYEN